MLFHKEKYHLFFLKFSIGANQPEKEDLLSSISHVAQQYLKGRAISILFFFVLYLITLLVIGIENALLLAAVAALVNIIPYLGPVLAAVLPTISALLTETDWQPGLWVLICFCLIQALDNYFVTPYFLGAEVNLSALTTFVAIICGGLVWGIMGMILFIPLFSIAKIIFDHVPSLQHYGMLIGDQEKKPTDKFLGWLKRAFRKRSNK